MRKQVYFYDAVSDSVVMTDKDGNELVIDCKKANAQVVFKDPTDVGYMIRLAMDELGNYVSYALKSGGLQGYVEAMNVFN